MCASLCPAATRGGKRALAAPHFSPRAKKLRNLARAIPQETGAMQNPSSTCPRCQSPIPTDAPGGICPSCALLGVAEPTDPAQATAAGTPTLDELAAAFPEYEMLGVIGQGGMGVVFKARQPRLDRLVALKILPPALAAQPGFAERFTREARALARLAHPHIVAVYDFGERAGFYYLMMEFVNGVNLRQAMRAGVTPVQALALVPRICEALQFAHDHGVLHRDIKPENILLDTAGTPKLADFGIAKFAGDTSAKTGLTETGATLGTAAYMSPEQIEKPATVDHRADIYSLGVVLYEMLTGELPLGRFAAPSEKSRVGPGVDEVVLRSLEKERERRQQSATEMKTQVEHAATQARASAPAAVANPWPNRLCWLIVGMFVLPLVAGFSAIAIPQLTMAGHEHRSHVGGGVVMLVALLPFLAGAALFFGYRRTRPGADRATPRAAWNPWPKRIFLLVLALIIVPVTLLGLGLAVPMLAYRSLQKPALATVSDAARPVAAEVVTHAPFIGHLGKSSIEIVSIAPHPAGENAGWQMDGRPSAEGPFVNRHSHSTAQPGDRAHEFIFRTSDLPADASTPVWHLPDAHGWAGGGSPARPAEPEKDLADCLIVTASFPGDLRTTDVWMGFATSPWTTLRENRPGNSIASSFSHEGEDWQVTQASTIEGKDDETIVTYASPTHADWQVRVVAVLADGREIAASRSSMLNDQSAWHFEKQPLESIAQFRFQTRRYEWVEFRGVALAPLEK